MPDLRRRPTRYATTLVVITALAAGAWSELDVRLGPDAALAAATTASAALTDQLASAQREAGSARAELADARRVRAAAASTGDAAGAAATDQGEGQAAADAVLLSGPGRVGSAVTAVAPAGTRTASTGNAAGCAAYPNQEAAQAAFDADRARLAALDGDGDGRACEQLRSRSTVVATVPAEKKDPTGTGTGAGTGRAGSGATAPAPASTPTTAPTASSAPDPRCDTYPDQEAAQAAFDADPVRLAVLDGDRDGRACEQLRSRTTPTVRITPPVVTPPRVTAPTKAEIVDSGRYFGMTTATDEEFTTLEATLGRQANLTGTYQGWDTDFEPARVTDAWRAGTLPLITWESRPLASEDTGTVDYSLSAIAAGAFDDYLTGYARDLAATGLPVAIRFDHEMNGDWYRWSTATGGTANANTYGNTPAQYVAAWRHVHDVFAAQGAGDLVVWVWAPNRVDNISSARFPSVASLYPGDAYVDWLGLTGYYRPEDVTRGDPTTFARTYQQTLTQLRALSTEPVLIAEVGATEQGSHKTAWVTSFFEGLAQQPDVVGFVWFNYAVSESGRTNDWRLNSTRPVFTAFQSGLLASQYGLDVGRSFRLQPIGATATASPTATSTATSSPSPTTTSTATTTTSPTASTAPTASPTTSVATASPTTSTTPTASPNASTPAPTPTPSTT